MPRLSPVLLGLLLLAQTAGAIEPTTVSVEAAVPITEETRGRTRELVFRAALNEAVFEVVRLPEKERKKVWKEAIWLFNHSPALLKMLFVMVNRKTTNSSY